LFPVNSYAFVSMDLCLMCYDKRSADNLLVGYLLSLGEIKRVRSKLLKDDSTTFYDPPYLVVKKEWLQR